jgi:tetratricopeptide (TPR) repeat protein
MLSQNTCVVCESHWVITEDGKIEAVTDSLLNMAQPHDLVQFLRQEEMVKTADEAKGQLNGQRNALYGYQEKDDPLIESKVMAGHPDCVSAGRPLSQHNLYISTVIPLEKMEIKVEDYIGRPFRAPSQPLVPFCTDAYDLPFSMLAYDHFESVQNRARLSMSPEASLSPLQFPGWSNASDFGHIIGTVLNVNPTSWVMYTLATFYWRVMGNAYQAIECVRRALHFSEQQYMHVSMLNLANIQHQTNHSSEAVMVLEAATILNNQSSLAYFTLAQALAVTLQLNQSVQAFEMALKIEPDFSLAATQLAAVRCHMKLESALQSQHSNLQQTLSELQSYKLRLRNLNTMTARITAQAASDLARQQMDLAFDYFTYGPIEGLYCGWYGPMGYRYMSCGTADLERYKVLRAQRITFTHPVKAANRQYSGRRPNSEQHSAGHVETQHAGSDETVLTLGV